MMQMTRVEVNTNKYSNSYSSREEELVHDPVSNIPTLSKWYTCPLCSPYLETTISFFSHPLQNNESFLNPIDDNLMSLPFSLARCIVHSWSSPHRNLESLLVSYSAHPLL